jgi:hypothetical protein
MKGVVLAILDRVKTKDLFTAAESQISNLNTSTPQRLNARSSMLDISTLNSILILPRPKGSRRQKLDSRVELL